jgi:NH3-dependent NAD+ synthetase
MEDALHKLRRREALKPSRPDADSRADTACDLEARTGLVKSEIQKMMRIAAITVLLAAAAVPAMGCDRPSAPGAIPDGKTAAKEEMLASKKEVDAFKSGMEEYIACEKSGAKRDAAAAELVKVADRFNAQVKAFKAKG